MNFLAWLLPVISLIGWMDMNLADAANARPLLLIGDSHTVGPFGRKLDSLLRESGKWQVSTLGACGSSVSSWLNGGRALCGYFEKRFDGKTVETNHPHSIPNMESLLERLSPRVTLVALGSNDLTIPTFVEEPAVRRLVTRIRESGSECVWIGPPDMRAFDPARMRSFYDLLNRVTADAGCQVLDSTTVTEYPESGGDGVHYSGPLGRLAEWWAEWVCNSLPSYSQ